jgi:hypothetical protein
MPNDPFTGLKLTDQSAAGSPRGLDQQLFTTPPPSPSQPSAEPEQPAAHPASTQPRATSTPKPKAKKPRTGTPAAPTPDGSFDINTTPTEWEALRLTGPEVIALEDAWHELRRLLGRKLAKNDVLRCAIHHVVTEYAAHKQDSILYRMLKEKKI